MSLWKKERESTAEVKRSGELCKKRDELEKTFPAIMQKWEELDNSEVRRAAEQLIVVERMQSREKLLAAQELLKKAIWRRDGIKGDFDRQFNQLCNDIEAINDPTIFSKVAQWQTDLKSLRGRKIVQSTRHWTDPEKGPRVRFKSNILMVDQAKQRLLSAISELRAMRRSPLAEIFAFIKKTENELSNLDLTILGDEQEASVERYAEIAAMPEMKVIETARLEPDKGGKLIVQKFERPLTEPGVKED